MQIQHLSNVASKQLSCGQNVYIDVNGRESIGIIRSANAAGYYDVAIEGRNVNVKRDEIRLLKNISPKSNVSKTRDNNAEGIVFRKRFKNQETFGGG